MDKYIFSQTDDEHIPVDLIDGYLLHSHLGDGVFGRVFKATQLKFPRTTVIKIPRDLGSLSTAEFSKEIERTAILRHPAIVTVYDTGNFDDPTRGQYPYMSMEYLEGETVQKRYKEIRRNLTLTQNLTLFLSICDAVLYAHKSGIYHCDLHAQNLLLMPVGSEYVVKIIDFGLASLLSKVDVEEGEAADFGSLCELLRGYFFFPDVNLTSDRIIHDAASILELRRRVQSILATRFSDRFVFADGTFRYDKEERAERLGQVALMFVKEKIFPKDIFTQVIPYLHADIFWNDYGSAYLFAFSPTCSSAFYGPFLLLCELSTIHLRHTQQSIWEALDSTSLDGDPIESFIREFFSAMDILLCVNMLDEAGFVHEQIKKGLEELFAWDSSLDVDWATSVPFNPLSPAKLIAYQALLTRFGRRDILKDPSEVDPRSEKYLRLALGFSYLLSKLTAPTISDTKVLRSYCQSFLDLFYAGRDLYLACINEKKQVSIVKVDIVKNIRRVDVYEQEDSIFIQFNATKLSGEEPYTLELNLESLIDLYACFLVDSHYSASISASQRYESGEVALIARRGVSGPIVELNNRVFHAKRIKSGETGYLKKLLPKLEKYMRQHAIPLGTLLERVDRLMLQQKEWLMHAMIFREDLYEEEPSYDYFEVASNFGKLITYDKGEGGLEWLDKVHARLVALLHERFD